MEILDLSFFSDRSVFGKMFAFDITHCETCSQLRNKPLCKNNGTSGFTFLGNEVEKTSFYTHKIEIL